MDKITCPACKQSIKYCASGVVSNNQLIADPRKREFKATHRAHLQPGKKFRVEYGLFDFSVTDEDTPYHNDMNE